MSVRNPLKGLDQNYMTVLPTAEAVGYGEKIDDVASEIS
jgi:hypothetical protein